MIGRKLRVAVAMIPIAIVIVAASYVPYASPRSSAGICKLEESACADAVLMQKSLGYGRTLDLGIIEFDDQGSFQKRELADAVLEHVEGLARATDPVTIVVFAHGWNHDAKPDDANLTSFVQLLEDLDCAEVRFAFYNEHGSPADVTDCQGAPQRKTIGIYLAWHGKSWRGPLHAFSFWARKATAERIGSRGGAETLYRLSALRSSRADDRNRLVIVGHSFGGSLVFSAAAHAVQQSVETLDVGRGPRFADIVVVVNAAFEAQAADSLYSRALQRYEELAARSGGFQANPLFVAITAKNDVATGWLFPFGRWLSTRLRHYRSNSPALTSAGSQAKADRTALGHYEPFQTHVVSTCERKTARLALECGADSAPESERTTDRGYYEDWKTTGSCWMGANGEGWRVRFPTAYLYHLSVEEGANRSPSRGLFMNIAAETGLVDDHGGIWKPSLRLFLRDLVALAYADTSLRDNGCPGA